VILSVVAGYHISWLLDLGRCGTGKLFMGTMWFYIIIGLDAAGVVGSVWVYYVKIKDCRKYKKLVDGG
jgi:hypothetical protein